MSGKNAASASKVSSEREDGDVADGRAGAGRDRGGRSLPAKAERLQVRVAAEHVELARRAAKLEGMTVSDFARRAVEERARETVERHRAADPNRITLDPVAFDAFLAACDAPPPPNETLRETIRASLAFDAE